MASVTITGEGLPALLLALALADRHAVHWNARYPSDALPAETLPVLLAPRPLHSAAPFAHHAPLASVMNHRAVAGFPATLQRFATWWTDMCGAPPPIDVLDAALVADGSNREMERIPRASGVLDAGDAWRIGRAALQRCTTTVIGHAPKQRRNAVSIMVMPTPYAILAAEPLGARTPLAVCTLLDPSTWRWSFAWRGMWHTAHLTSVASNAQRFGATPNEAQDRAWSAIRRTEGVIAIWLHDMSALVDAPDIVTLVQTWMDAWIR